MSTNHALTSASAQEVYDVLADGWLLAAWVVGASRIRAVDARWPAEGSTVHHSYGPWPVVVDDTTTVLRAVPGRLLHMRARGWPAGEAEIEMEMLDAVGGGTLVVMREWATAGPGSWIPPHVEDAALHVRNREALNRLVLMVEGRHAGAPAAR